MSDLRKSVLELSSKRSSGLLSRHLGSASKQEFTPLKWSEYFDKNERVSIEAGEFNIYTKGSEGPVLLCLHGGGYSGLTWALFAKEILKLIHCQVIAIDLRGHGKTTTNNNADLSLETLAKDVIDITEKLTGESGTPVVLVGHSMGGAVAVEAASYMPTVVGLCVIDVVEGTALDALSSMQSILRGRPAHFKSLPHAIQWCYKGGQTHNLEAARVSMPGQITNIQTGKLAADDCDNVDFQNIELPTSRVRMGSFALAEVTEEGEEKEETDKCDDIGKPPLPKSQKTELFIAPNSKVQGDGPTYTWRIDLSKTESFWTGWFKGLSQKFLDVRVPKLLLLANIFGLDTALTVGQMQGKFQMQVLAKSGHAIHEDQPQHVAEILSGYLVKQKIATPMSTFVHPNLPSC